MRKKLLAVGRIVFLLWLLSWCMAPTLAVWSLAIAEKKGEEGSQRACDRIVYFGERSISPILSSLERNSPWQRRYCYLPVALERIGGSAHPRLLEAIDQQADPKIRAYLISALISAFHDTSRLSLFLEDAAKGQASEWAWMNIWDEVNLVLPDAPRFLDKNEAISQEFLDYWAKRQMKTR